MLSNTICIDFVSLYVDNGDTGGDSGYTESTQRFERHRNSENTEIRRERFRRRRDSGYTESVSTKGKYLRHRTYI